MANKIGVVLALDGEREFTQGMKNAKDSVKYCNDELKNIKQEFSDAANSMGALTSKQEALTKKQEAYERVLKAAKTGQDNAKKQYKDQAKALEDLKKELDEAKSALDKMEKSGDTSSKSYRDQVAAVEKLSSAVDKQTVNYLKAEGRLSKWDHEVAQAEKDVKNNSAAVQKNAKYIDEAKKSADGCATSIDKYGKEVKEAGDETKKSADQAKEASEVYTSFGEKLGTAIAAKGVELAASAVQLLGQKVKEAAKYVVDVGSKFEASMSKVKALSGAGGEEFEALSTKAQELGSSTQYSASEVADAFGYMSLAGWDTASMLDGIDGVLNLAAASQMDLAQASDMVTDYLSAFGLTAADAGRMADQMAYAQANSNTSTVQLGDAFGNCAANMHAAGQSMETTTAMLEAMANQGTKGSEAGTALSAVMRDIGQKSKNGAIQIGNASVKVQDAQGNYRSLTDILQDVEAATEGMGTAQKDAALRTTFTKNSIKAVNEILTEGVGKVKGYETALNNCDGAAGDMASTMTDNLQGALTNLDSATEGLGIALYKQISGPMTNAIRGVSGVLNMITKAITPQKTELETFLDDVIETDKRISGLLDAAQEDVDNAEAEVNKLEGYKNTILNLQKIIDNGGQLDSYQLFQMKNAVNAVSGAVPEIGNNFDEVTGKISLTTTEIEKAFAAAESGILKAAIARSMDEIMQAEVDALSNEVSALAAVNAAKRELETFETDNNIAEGFDPDRFDIRDKWEDLKDKVTETEGVYETAQQTTEEAVQKEKDLNDALEVVYEKYGHVGNATEDTTDKTEDFADGQGDAADALGATGDAADEASDAVDGLGDSEEEAKKKAEEAAKAIKQAHDDAAKQVKDAYESTKKEVESAWNISPFSGWEQKEEEGLDKFMSSLQSQIDGITNYKNNLSILREGLRDENGNISDENARFLTYVEGLGTSGAQLVQDLAGAVGSEDPSKLTEAVRRYTDAMDVESDIEQVITRDKMAVQLGLKELGSSAEEWAGLSSVVNTIQEDGKDIPQAIKNSFNQAAVVAKAMGVKIPDGLADGIESSDKPSEAITLATAQLRGAISGQASALLTAAKDMGIEVPDEVASGIEAGGQTAIDAYNELVALVAAMNVDTSGVEENIAKVPEAAQTAIESGEAAVQTAAEGLGDAAGNVTADTATATAAGASFATSYAAGIMTGQSLAQTSAQALANAAAVSANNVRSTFQSAGRIAGSTYASGVRSQTGSARSAGSSVASSARSGASGQSLYSAGYNMAAGLASGIRAGQSRAVNAAIALARASITAAKKELQVKSPSRVFRDQVGKQVAVGWAFGIKQGTPTVIKEIEALGKNTMTAATKWLANYKGKNKTTWQDEEYFWDKMTNVVKRGTAAYDQVIANWTGVNIDNAFGVSRTETRTTGSGKDKKTETVVKEAADYYQEILRAAETFTTKLEAKDNFSIREQQKYWAKVRNLMDSSSESYWEIVQKQLELNAMIGNMDVAESILENYQTYYDMSEQAIVDYWDKVRKKYTAGTEERIRADQNYLNAKKDLDDKLADIEENYADKVEDANQRYLDALEKRKEAIMDAFGLFEEFESKSDSGEQLLFNIKSQAAGYEDWSETLDELQKRGIFSDELMRVLTEKGPADVAALKALLMLTDEQLKEYQKAYDRKEAAALKQAEEDTADIKKSVETEIADLKAAEAKELAAVKEHISSDLLTLANNVRSIAEDQTSALVGAFSAVGTKLADSTGKSVSDQTLNAVDVNRNGTQKAVTEAQAVKAAKTATTTTKTTTTTTKATTTTNNANKYKLTRAYNLREKASTSSNSLVVVPKGQTVEYTGKKDGQWWQVKYGNKTGWIYNGSGALQKAAKGIYSALRGLTLTDEEGLGSEAILTSQGVLRQLDAGDTVFNAMQRRNLWELSKLQMPDVASMASLNQRLADGYSAQVRASSATNDLLSGMAQLMSQFMPYLAQSNQVYLDGKALVSGTAAGMSQSLAARARRKR